VYGSGVFRINNYYFWVPIIGPIIGAIVGVWTYEGYILVMKRYANLPDIVHIEAVEQSNQEEFHERRRKITAHISYESESFLCELFGFKYFFCF
jgi:hypothetical protein